MLLYTYQKYCLFRFIHNPFHTYLLCIFAFTISTNVNSQEEKNSNLPSNITYEMLSEAKTLAEAKQLKNSNPQRSLTLANQALRLSGNNNNHAIQAQTHNFLGELAQYGNDIEKSLSHYLQATLLFKKLNDKNGQISAAINYSKLLLVEKEFTKADSILDDIIAVAIDHEDQQKISQTIALKANSFYIQKKYTQAIQQFQKALTYLSGNDKLTQQNLAEIYSNIAAAYRDLKNNDKESFFYKKSLSFYTNLRNKELMAKTLHKISLAERDLGNLVVALDYSMRGLEIYAQVGESKSRAEALTGAGIIYRYIGRYEKSLKHVYEAHLYYKKINDINGIADTSNQMGLIYTRLKQFDEAKSFYQKTIDLSGKKIEKRIIASALREMAVINLGSKNYKVAETMAKEALAIYNIENDKTKESTTSRILGNIYREQNQDTKAIIYYRESLSLAVESKSELYQIKSLIPLASILIGKNTKESVNLLKESLKLSIKINNKPNQLYAYRLLRESEKTQGNINKALEYAEKEVYLTNILQNERENNELVLQKANLHSHKMEIELESLREKAIFSELELAKKNNEIEIAKQSRTITELELIKNKYANIALALLLAICVLLVVFIFRRFVASNKRNRELDYLAARDPLTNCYNRRILFDHLDKDFSLEKLNDYCIIMADIDHFKGVNDTYGHKAGDIVLRDVATIFQKCVRKNDIVARYGGEEFCIILHRVAHVQAMRIAESMRYKVEKSLFGNLSVTCSFGVTSIEFNAQSSTEIIEQADLALYKSKANGRNKVTLWDKALKAPKEFT